jgi:hypothetical protein
VGQWGSYGTPGEWPGDQRAADGESLTFDSRPAAEPVDILGYPLLDLSLSVDRPLALVAARLCDVAPDGASTLVSWGLLNLTHRRSHEFPEPLIPNQRYDVTVQLNVVGHRLAAGHHWRIAISPTYMRHAWPSPEPVTLTIYGGPQSRVRLPVRTPHPGDAALPPFPPAEVAPPLAMAELRASQSSKLIRHDLITDVTELYLTDDAGRQRHVASGMEVDDSVTERYTIADGRPLSLVVHIERTLELQRGDWRVRVETESEMTADRTHFHLRNRVKALEGDEPVFDHTWIKAIPRLLV